MTAPAKPTIDELIRYVEGNNGFPSFRNDLKEREILCILNTHKRITESAGRPEPVAWMMWMPMSGKGIQFTTDAKSVAECNRADIDITPLCPLAAYDRVAAERDAMEAERDDLRCKVPPCLECGAVTAKDAETKCKCSGDKDDCHGCGLWPHGSVAEAESYATHEHRRANTAQRQLAELQRKHDGLVADYDALLKAMTHDKPPTVEQWKAIRLAAMSAVALREAGDA